MNAPQEGWQHQESFDDRLIEGDDFDTEVTIYQNKPYPTINAYFALATKLGMDIDEVVEKESDTEWIVRARATWEDSDKTMHRWGAAADKKNDKHGYAKAWGKAQRNAFKGFLRGHPEMKKAIKGFIATSDAQQNIETPTPQPAPPQQKPQQESGEMTPRIRASQALVRNKETLERDHHIPAKLLAAATEHHFRVDSLDNLPDSAWRETEVHLNTGEFHVFKEWIEAMRQDDNNPV